MVDGQSVAGYQSSLDQGVRSAVPTEDFVDDGSQGGGGLGRSEEAIEAF